MDETELSEEKSSLQSDVPMTSKMAQEHDTSKPTRSSGRRSSKEDVTPAKPRPQSKTPTNESKPKTVFNFNFNIALCICI